MRIRFLGGPSGSLRVFRGGSWNYDPALARVAYRSGDTPGLRWNFLGLRLILVLR